MVKQEPVNLTHQMILSVIPVVNFYAFYRIQKLRMFFLVSVVVYICAIILLTGLNFVMLFLFGTEENLATYTGVISSLDTPPSQIIIITIISLISLYLVRRWSKQWNKHLDGSDTEQIPTKEWDD